jgi:hypothetical protein
MLPFTHDQFIATFVAYNDGVWPAQLVAYLVGLVIIVLVVRPSKVGHRVIASGLAAMWIWTGVAYHWLYFAAINKAALGFGALFVVQGIACIYAGATGRLRFASRSGFAAWLGWAFVAYATVAYPLVGVLAGHRYPGMPTFGITPCPVTLFGFGLILLATPNVPPWLLVVPFIWSLIGGSAAILLGMPQDWLLLLSGVAVAAVVALERGRDRPAISP